jgi:hypothetical protein
MPLPGDGTQEIIAEADALQTRAETLSCHCGEGLLDQAERLLDVKLAGLMPSCGLRRGRRMRIHVHH